MEEIEDIDGGVEVDAVDMSERDNPPLEDTSAKANDVAVIEAVGHAAFGGLARLLGAQPSAVGQLDEWARATAGSLDAYNIKVPPFFVALVHTAKVVARIVTARKK